jgi:branched-chain amino acid aminotransferase
MHPDGYFNYNGKLYKNEKSVISLSNRSFSYGDRCFETLKMLNGKTCLHTMHLERLFVSLRQLHFNRPNYFITDAFQEQVLEVAKKNHHKKAARVRITIARGDGGLYDPENDFPNYVIQTWDLNSANNRLNENGLVVGIHTDARKINDAFSHIKSNNYLCFAMAAYWATENKLNDALMLNAQGNVADTTIAYVFIVQNGVIKTPALTEGCVGGSMRKYLLKCLREESIPVEETTISPDDVLNASEVFFTNTIFSIKWVKEVINVHYKTQTAPLLYEKFIAPLWNQ